MTLITFGCRCGAPLKAKAETAGKRTKCPHCGAIITIPGGGKPKPQGSEEDDDVLKSDYDWSTIEVDSKTAFPAQPDLSQGSALIPIIPETPPPAPAPPEPEP